VPAERPVQAGPSPRARLPFFNLLLAALGLVLIYLAAANLGPVIRAALPGDGVHGTFTARHLVCIQHPGHQACDWYGDFRAGDGRFQSNVFLYGSDRSLLTAGQQTLARDVGRPSRVYGPHGSHEWILTAILLLAGTAVLLKTALLPIYRRATVTRAEARTPVGERGRSGGGVSGLRPAPGGEGDDKNGDPFPFPH
jgi:hypothetical protein